MKTFTFILLTIIYAMDMSAQTTGRQFVEEGKYWGNGQVLSAPFWVGYRNVNQAFRIGVSAKVIQSLTQNLVHKFMDTPYFIHYNNFKSGPFSYYGYYNPLTLWNK